MATDNHTSHLQLVTTADGSKTIYNSLVGENYHSKHGALQESRHVFVESGLKYFLDKTPNKQDEVSVLEVGFGTGLNFLLSADFCLGQQIKLQYTGIEAFPLTSEMISLTGYQEYITAPVWNTFLERYQLSLSEPATLSDYVQLQIAVSDLFSFTTPDKFDVIYFDAFAAVHQPEMWTNEAIAHTLNFLKPGGIFVTYAITGNLKRCIKALGLKVEKAPGAPGKREMLRAVK